MLYLVYEVERGNDMAKKVYEVEFKGQAQKFQFETKQQAEDFATIQAVFGGKQYRIQAIFIQEEVAKWVTGQKKSWL